MNRPVSSGEDGADVDARTRREGDAEFWENALRWGLPRFPPWVKYFSFAFTGGPIGLALLTAGVVFADAGIAVPGAVFVCLALCSLIVGIRIRRRRAAPR